MRRMTILLVTVILVLFAWSASAALITDTMDEVEAEVQARIDDLEAVGDLTKDEQKSLKSYEKAMDSLTADSRSRKDDSKYIDKAAKEIFKVDEEDAAMMDLLDDGLMGFAGELNADLAWAQQKLDACDPDTNSKQASAAKAYDKAVSASEDVPLAENAKDTAKAIKKFESKLSGAEKKTDAALALEEDLTAHEQAYFVDLVAYEGAETCIACHTTTGDDVMATGHWNWEGVSEGIEGHETEIHGKTDLINNFCIAIPTNEPRCTQCHVGYGWADGSFDHTDETKIDCLVCHDTTGTYVKDKKTAGNPASGVDLQDVALNVGTPGRKNCGACHFTAGGGDNVKHGDLASTIVSTTRDMDVHMGTDGENFSCQECHTTTNHLIAGMPLHSRDGGPVECQECHTDVHATGLLNAHVERIACQTCHIPAFSRALPTKTEWYWEDAGQDIDPIPVDEYGKPLYDKMKGTFVWGMNVVPELKWFNGKWNRMMINTNEGFSSTPVQLATPVGDIGDTTAKIYPFKKMVGTQPADAVLNTMLVPHLFGKIGGPNPYWGAYDWHLALEDGAAYTGQTYSGNYMFVETEMYLSVNHEIAPSEQARSCSSCHSATTGIDFIGLGYPSNPSPMP